MTVDIQTMKCIRRSALVMLALALCACAGAKKDEAGDKKGDATATAKAESDSAKGEDAQAAPAEDEAPPPVVGAQTDVVSARPFTETIGAIGNVAARPGHVASLGAAAAARVTSVLVTTGDRVRAGQPLITLDTTIVAATARSAAAAVTVAERASERAQRLVSEGISPRRESEQAAAELARARAEFLAARRAQELSTLRSPISGVVTRMTATLGATADPAQSLIEVADPSALDLLFALTPSDARRVRRGARVSLTAGQQATGESLGSATVYDVGGVVDSASRSVIVRVRIGAGARSVRLGETVYGEISVGTRPAALAVPLKALVPDGDGFKLFVVDDEGVAHARPVQVGARTDSIAEIIKGVTAGERFVTTGAFGVTDGARIVGGSAPAAKPGAKEK